MGDVSVSAHGDASPAVSHREAEVEAMLDRPAWRASLARVVMSVLVRTTLRLRVEGLDRYPAVPAVVCFSHQSWFDPFVLIAALPGRPRVSFFGPREADMSVGRRNRLMSWVGWAVPYRPDKDDLIASTRRVGRVLARGHVLLIAGEGRIHVGEGSLLPLSDGPAFFALRSGVSLVPIAVNGTGWLAFGRTVRIRVGEPIPVAGRPTRANVDALTARCASDLRALVAGFPDKPPPGRFWRRVTELFNEWPEGSRPAWPGSRDQTIRSISDVGGRTQTLRYCGDEATAGGQVGATGLAADPTEYRARLKEQSDEQIDAWAAELMRDVAVRCGVVKVVADFVRATGLDERELERVFAAGGGPPAVVGRDASGHLVLPAATLHCLVPGLRSEAPDARPRLIEYLAESFDEIVYA